MVEMPLSDVVLDFNTTKGVFFQGVQRISGYLMFRQAMATSISLRSSSGYNSAVCSVCRDK